MTISHVVPETAVGNVVEALGFDRDDVDLTAPEVLAEIVRRTASLRCPVTPRQLRETVVEAACGLVAVGTDEARSLVRAAIEHVVAYGDLVDLPVVAESGAEIRTLFLGQPSFVDLESSFVLMGVRAEAVPLLSGHLAKAIDRDAHVRRLAPDAASPDDLVSLGLQALNVQEWLHHPPFCEAHQLVDVYDARLSAAGPAGTIDECQLLDWSAPTNYYRGRWRPLKSTDVGRFVARRPAAYGVPMWSYAEIEGGVVRRLIDLPVSSRLHRPCDEAWRLQAAIDASRKVPQQVRVDRGSRPGMVVLGCLSPLPGWAQRRLDSVGRSVTPHRSIVSYALRESDLCHELEFLEASIWTVPLTDGATL